MELKLSQDVRGRTLGDRINRSLVELKRGVDVDGGGGDLGINRSLVELKPLKYLAAAVLLGAYQSLLSGVETRRG